MTDLRVSFEGRGVPQHHDAERSVLGALLLHADAVADVQFLKPEDFHLPRHQIVFTAILAAYNARNATDLLVVEDELARMGRLEEIGGKGTLLDLVESVVTAAGVVYHAEIVREKSIQRRLLETCLDIARLAYENSMEAKDLLDEAERKIFEIAGLDKSSDAVSIANILQSTFERIDKLRDREGRLTGLGTDYYDLDD